MTRLVRTALLFAGMVAAATAASTASAASWKTCGDIAATQHIRALDLTCYSARALAERHSDTSIPYPAAAAVAGLLHEPPLRAREATGRSSASG